MDHSNCIINWLMNYVLETPFGKLLVTGNNSYYRSKNVGRSSAVQETI